MTSRDFCYWLQGYFEIHEMDFWSPEGRQVDTWTLTPAQIKAIRIHLSMVFAHEIDPSFGSKPHQEALNEIHSGKDPFAHLKNQDPNSDIKIRC